jgi:hypothetical protein
VMQLGQVIGVSTVGTLFISLSSGGGSASMPTALLLAGLAVLAGLSSLFLVRPQTMDKLG